MQQRPYRIKSRGHLTCRNDLLRLHALAGKQGSPSLEGLAGVIHSAGRYTGIQHPAVDDSTWHD